MKQPKNSSRIISIKIIFTILIFTLVCQHSFSQSPSPSPSLNGIIFSPWRIAGESRASIDVSYRVVKCDTLNQIHLKVFNESNVDQIASFKLEIKNNSNGESFSHSVTIPVLRMKELIGDCLKKDNLSVLKINLPASYNPNNISIIILF